MPHHRALVKYLTNLFVPLVRSEAGKTRRTFKLRRRLAVWRPLLASGCVAIHPPVVSSVHTAFSFVLPSSFLFRSDLCFTSASVTPTYRRVPARVPQDKRLPDEAGQTIGGGRAKGAIACWCSRRIAKLQVGKYLHPWPNTLLLPPSPWRHPVNCPETTGRLIVQAQEGPLSAGPWSCTQPRLETLLSADVTGGRRIVLLAWPVYCLVGLAGVTSSCWSGG